MKGPALIGLLLLAAGALLFFTGPSHVTWGNHHYARHLISYVLLGVGALFLVVGSRR